MVAGIHAYSEKTSSTPGAETAWGPRWVLYAGDGLGPGKYCNFSHVWASGPEGGAREAS